MQEMTLQELGERSSARMEQEQTSLMRQLQAQKAIATELQAMKSEEKILMLSEEEERMLRAFRAFKLRGKAGDVFKWQTHPETTGVVLAAETGLVADPQEIG